MIIDKLSVISYNALSPSYRTSRSVQHVNSICFSSNAVFLFFWSLMAIIIMWYFGFQSRFAEALIIKPPISMAFKDMPVLSSCYLYNTRHNILGIIENISSLIRLIFCISSSYYLMTETPSKFRSVSTCICYSTTKAVNVSQMLKSETFYKSYIF